MFFGLQGGQASAQGVKVDYLARFKKEMPKVEKMPEAEFMEQTKLLEVRPTGDAALGFSMRIPKDWTKADETASSNFQISDKLFTQIAMYYGPASIYGQSRLEVKAVTLDFDYEAEQWFIQYMMSVGQTTEGYTYHNKKRVEAMMIVMEGDVSYVKRILVQINGKRVIFTEFMVPVDLWDTLGGLQASVLESFKILKPIQTTVVTTIPYQILDIAQINYPDFWEDEPDAMTSVERLGVRFFNYLDKGEEGQNKRDKSVVQGRIDVSLVASWASASILEELETFRKGAEVNDLLIGERFDTIKDYKYNPDVQFSATEVYRVINNTDNAREYEYWFTLLIAENYYYFISLMTPSRNDNYRMWVRNMQSYRILVEGIKPAKPIR